MVDVQGSRLRLMSGDQGMALLRRLYLGMKPTRLDGAIDFVGQSLNLCSNAEASCERGELCLIRRFSPNNEYRSNNIPTRLLLKLGARDSAVCGRIYDKGLEQGIPVRGLWERLEIEWKDDRAGTVGRELYDAGDAWHAKLVELVLGAIDFREQNGRPELARRPRAAWWANLLNGHSTATTRPAMEAKTFEKWYAGFVQSYGRRLLEMAEAVEQPVGEVVAFLLNGVKASENGRELIGAFQAVYSPDERTQ